MAVPAVKDEPDLETHHDAIWDVTTQALAPLVQACRLPDGPRVAKKVRDYFRRAGRLIAFSRRRWDVLMRQFADSAFNALFAAMGDQEWVKEVDFLLVMDVALREAFPEEVLRSVPQAAYEEALVDAHDRAFCEQRMVQVSREVVWENVRGDRTRKRLHAVLVDAWRSVWQCGDFNHMTVQAASEAFTEQWVKQSLAQLDDDAGTLDWTLPEAAAEQIFSGLLVRGAACHLPPPAGGSAPSDLTFVASLVHYAYRACEGNWGGETQSSANDGTWQGPRKRRRSL